MLRYLIALSVCLCTMSLVSACDGETKYVYVGNTSSPSDNEEDASVTVMDASVDAERTMLSEPLRIGAMLPDLGGRPGFGSGWETVANLAVDLVNASGGVRGQPVEIVFTRDPDSVDVAGQNFRDLVENEGVHAIVGPIRPVPAFAVGDFARQRAVPYMSIQGGFGAPFANQEDPWGLSPWSPLETQLEAAPALAADNFECETYGVVLVDRVRDELNEEAILTARAGAEAQGLTWGGHHAVFSTAPGNVEKLRESFPEGPPDCLYTEFRSTAQMVRDLPVAFPEDEYDYTVIYNNPPLRLELLTFGVTDPSVTLGKHALFLTDWSAELRQDFLDFYDRETGKELDLTGGPIQFYDFLMLIMLAVEETGSLAGADIRAGVISVADTQPGDVKVTATDYAEALAALRAGKHLDYRSLLADFDFEEGRSVPNTVRWSLVEITDGVWDLEYQNQKYLDSVEVYYYEEP